MNPGKRRAYRLELIGFAAAAVVLYRLELLSLVFLLPVQLAWIRHGESGGLYSSGMTIAALLALAIVDMNRFAGGAGLTVHLLGVVVAFAFLGGLFVLNSRSVPGPGGRRLRVSERAGLAAAAAAVTFGLFAIVAGDGLWEGYVTLQLAERPELLAQVQASREEIVALSAQAFAIVARGATAGYLAVLLGSWWAGSLIAFRTRFPLPEGNPVMQEIAGYTLSRFTVPVNWVWVLIAGWAGVVLVTITEISWLAVVAWNVALGAMVLYAVQGIAILFFLIGRRHGDNRLRMLLAGGFVLGLLIPGVRVAIAVGVPLLGVSEIWVTFRRFEGSEDTDESHS